MNILVKKKGQVLMDITRINTQGRILGFDAQMDYEAMNEYTDVLCARYPFLSVTSIGQTCLGRRIPLLSIGKGKKSVLYVGGCSANESPTAAVLLRFVNEYCDYIASDSRAYGYSMAYLFSTRTVSVIPMLNPDGIEYFTHGMPENDPFGKRQNVGSVSEWRGNARGIALRQNFGEAFEECRVDEYESESGALRNYLMYNRDIRLSLMLGRGERGVLCTYEKTTPPRLNPIGSALANMCIGEYKRCTVDGSLGAFCAHELIIPSFELNSEYVDKEDIFGDYICLRKALFCAPTLI